MLAQLFDSPAQGATMAVAVLSLFMSTYSLLLKRRRAAANVRARFLEGIVERRIRCYPKLWEIVERSHRSSQEIPDSAFDTNWASQCLADLWSWYVTEGNGIFLNRDTRARFLELQDVLKWFERSSANKNLDFEQEKRIRENPGDVYAFIPFNATNAKMRVVARAGRLRAELRADVKVDTRRSENLEV